MEALTFTADTAGLQRLFPKVWGTNTPQWRPINTKGHCGLKVHLTPHLQYKELSETPECSYQEGKRNASTGSNGGKFWNERIFTLKITEFKIGYDGPKTLIGTSPNKIYRGQVSIWKDGPCYMSTRKYKLKQQWDITTIYLSIRIAKIRWHRILARTWNNRNSHSLLVGMQNGTATLEGSLTVSYKTKQSCHKF